MSVSSLHSQVQPVPLSARIQGLRPLNLKARIARLTKEQFAVLERVHKGSLEPMIIEGFSLKRLIQKVRSKNGSGFSYQVEEEDGLLNWLAKSPEKTTGRVYRRDIVQEPVKL